jgi:hypothetical protein
MIGGGTGQSLAFTATMEGLPPPSDQLGAR